MHIQKKIRSAILDFGKKGKKPLFSAVTLHTGHLEGWLYWWKAMASLHIGHGILISHLVLHYFRYKMAAEVCQYLRGSSWAHRLDGPHVLYIKMIIWVPPVNLCTITSAANHPDIIITSLLIWNNNTKYHIHFHWSLFTVGQSEWNWSFVHQVNTGKGMPNQTEGWMKTNMHGAGFQKLETKNQLLIHSSYRDG